MSTLEIILFGIFFIAHSIFLAIVIYNLVSAPKIFNQKIVVTAQPKISILIPARNEEHNISLLLNSILNQSYENYEVIVLNDNSTDSTAAIVQQFSNRSSKIKLIEGDELPEDWLGKNWACYQLSKNAEVDYLLFLDADVELSENALGLLIYHFNKAKVSMLSVFPTQKSNTLGEWLIVPLMNWLLLNLLPLNFVAKFRSSLFTAANGQVILIDRKTYEQIGTHKSFKNEIVEDMEMAKRVKSSGTKIITMLGGESVFCKMYSSFGDAFRGFSKNFYSGFRISKPIFFILLVTLFTLFFVPIVFYLINDIFLLIILMIALERTFISLLSNQNWFLNCLLHPLQMVLMFLIGLKSLKGKNLKWKGRSI